MAACDYPGCQWKGNPRPYARIRDGVPSVTTISGLGDDKTGMQWAAAMIAATTAIHHHEAYAGLSQANCTEEKEGLCPTCRFLRSEHDRRWKAKAALGSHVHHLIADLAGGAEITSDEKIDPYLDAWDAFVLDCQPEWLQLEATVLFDTNPDIKYRGTLDLIGNLTVNGERSTWLIDWKTGRFVPVSQTLQLAALRHANYLTEWQGKTETVIGPVPKVDHCGVVMLGEDGCYELRELPADREAWTAFINLRRAWDRQNRIERWAKDNPEPVSTNAGPEAAA